MAPKGGLSPLLCHADGERGDKYDNHTEKVMPLAKKEGWTDIDMKGDWNTVFPVEKLFGDGFVLERFSFRGGTDTINGGAAGGWTDTIQVQDASGGSNLDTYGVD